MTIKEIIQACLPIVGLPADPIQNDVLAFCIARVNTDGRKIYDAWPWDNSKTPIFSISSDANGVIKFASTVDVVRAVRKAGDGDGVSSLFAEDEVLKARTGESVSSDSFQYLPDDGGCRRIKVADADTSYRVLTLARFVPFTTANYATASFPIDRAEPALVEYLSDALREWQGLPRLDRGVDAMRIALSRETQHAAKEFRAYPASPMFQEVGGW